MDDLILARPSAFAPLAIFDFDGTLVKPQEGRPFPKDVTDWEFTRPSVPSVLQGFGATHRLVIVTDQSKPWKLDQIHAVMKAVGVDPSLVVAATKELQKPSTVLFDRLLPPGSYDKVTAMYVGDAAGRPGDWSDCDRVFAERIGVRFQVPEQVFPLERLPHRPIPPAPGKEVVILVGFPASGKSTIAKEALAAYHHVDGDVFKTPAAMRREAALHVATQSIVFDCTGSTRKKRAEFIEFARKNGLPARIVCVPTTIEQAMEQNKQRFLEGGRKVPDVAFHVFRKNFEPPAEDEGATVVLL